MAGLVEAATSAAPEVLREGSKEAPSVVPITLLRLSDLHFTHFGCPFRHDFPDFHGLLMGTAQPVESPASAASGESTDALRRME